MGILDNVKNIFKREEKINQYNKGGEKEGRWQEEIEGDKTSGNYVNGNKEGKWTTINKDNSILEENYVNGFVEGISKEFYPPTIEKDSFGNSQLIPGEIKSEINHDNGIIKEYYENGKLKLEGIKFEDSFPDYDDVTTTYNHFTKDFKKYYENGNLEFECDNNHIKEYYENGNLKYSAFPDKNCQNALAEENYYYENGNLKQEVKYQISEFTEKETYSNYYESFVSQIKDYNEEGNLEKERTLLQGTIKEEIEWKNNEMITYRKYSKEGIILEDIDRNHSGEKVIENYDNGQLKSSKEYDENGKITDTWNFYDKSGNIEKMMLYTNGKLTEESKKEPSITEIGYVHYVYNGHEDVQRIEYAPKEDEYMKIYHLKDGTKDIYHEKEEVTLYEKHNEKGTIVERGQFDEESKQTGTWEYYDNSGKLTEKKEFQEGKEVEKEKSSKKKNPWAKSKGKDKESENER